MRIAGIIAEYNPFHEGHHYLIQKVREELGANTPIVIIMSGDFVQRGEPAIIDRRSRTCAALSCGADLVFELPFTFACASADRFAHGAVASLLATAQVTDLYFGAEHDSLSDLMSIASINFEQDTVFQEILDQKIREGLPYAAAWEAAAGASLLAKSDSEFALNTEEFSAIIREPNNLLAISYLREILSSSATLTPHVVRRIGAYNNDTLSEDSLPSATAVRQQLLVQYRRLTHSEWISKMGELAGFISSPMRAERLQSWNAGVPPLGEETLLQAAFPLIRAMSADDLAQYAYMGSGLASHLKNTISKLHYQPELSLAEVFHNEISTRCFSYTRILRALSSLVIGQKEHELQDLTDPKYLRLLGFSEKGRTLLKEMRQSIAMPIFSRASDVRHYGKDLTLTRMDELDRISHDFWTFQAKGTWEEDFHHEVIQFKRNKIYR